MGEASTGETGGVPPHVALLVTLFFFFRRDEIRASLRALAPF